MAWPRPAPEQPRFGQRPRVSRAHHHHRRRGRDQRIAASTTTSDRATTWPDPIISVAKQSSPAHPLARRKAQNPIVHHRWPAGSYIGGYRIPAGARYPSQMSSLTWSCRHPKAVIYSASNTSRISHEIADEGTPGVLAGMRTLFALLSFSTDPRPDGRRARIRRPGACERRKCPRAVTVDVMEPNR